MNLQFKNPVFNNDVNVTVRRGVKWAIEEEPEFGFWIVNTNDMIKEDGKTKIIGFAEIIDRKVIRFTDIHADMIQHEHDPDCRTYSGLFEVMKRTYDNFNEYEIVTILTFNFKPIKG